MTKLRIYSELGKMARMEAIRAGFTLSEVLAAKNFNCGQFENVFNGSGSVNIRPKKEEQIMQAFSFLTPRKKRKMRQIMSAMRVAAVEKKLQNRREKGSIKRIAAESTHAEKREPPDVKKAPSWVVHSVTGSNSPNNTQVNALAINILTSINTMLQAITTSGYTITMRENKEK